jgi:hypothetical protein
MLSICVTRETTICNKQQKHDHEPRTRTGLQVKGLKRETREKEVSLHQREL